MSTPVASSALQPHADRLISRRRLYLIGNLSIFTIGLGFAVRAGIAGHLQTDIFDPIDMTTSATRVGEALGATFLGFALTLLFSSALVDWIGMRRILLLSAVGYVVGGALVLLAAWLPPSDSSLWLVSAGLLLTGLGWGAIEAVCNPMITALYPEDKTRRLNFMHAWWPGGIAIGGMLGVGINYLHLPWQTNLVLLMLPALVLMALVARTHFPVTARVAAGIGTRDMYLELVRSPGVWIWLFCMALTASAELAPAQWIDLALSRVVGMQGLLLLVYVNVLIFALRYFAGPLTRWLSPLGVLFCGSVGAALGLYWLSSAQAPVTAMLAATLWAIGIAYFWPTMIASVADRYPRGGAFLMGVMGFVGGMALHIVMPFMGSVFDRSRLEAAGGSEQLLALHGAQLDAVLQHAAESSFRSIALLPLLLIPIFGVMWWRERTVAKSRVVAASASANV